MTRFIRPLPTLLLASMIGACSTINPTGDIPKRSTLIADANVRVSPNYSITIEKIVYGAAGVALLYYLYDPLAPNWETREEMVAEDTYRLSMQMKRFHIGGDGEAGPIFRRWAEALQQENGASDYRILALTEGIDSSTPIARRQAIGTIRLVREPAVQAVSMEVAPFPAADPVAASPVSLSAITLPIGDDRSLEVAPVSAEAPADRNDHNPAQRAARPLPRPLPPEVIDGALLRVRLDARALFAFDEAVLSAEGRVVLDREVVGRRDELGPVTVLIVSGHADRIGSYEYNQKLSAARAQAVRSYLIRRGFPVQAIRTEAHGERRPLATVECDDALPRQAMIDCLAANRRVEVRADAPPR